MRVFGVTNGIVPLERTQQSAFYALADWANDCERKLLGLSCGYSLPRNRHEAWAASVLPTMTIEAVGPDGGFYAVGGAK